MLDSHKAAQVEMLVQSAGEVVDWACSVIDTGVARRWPGLALVRQARAVLGLSLIHI